MSLLAKEMGGGRDFEPLPEGVHIAVCYAVVDLGTHDDEYKGVHKDRHEILIGWEVPAERIELERDGQMVDLPRAISRRFTLSLSEKSNLRPFLQSWRGKAFTADELAGFDLAVLIGAPCQLQVLHAVSKSNGKTYANISAIMPMPKGAAAPECENAPQYYSVDDHGAAIPENIPDWMAEIIRSSYEYAELAGTTTEDAAPDFTDETLPF